MRKSKEFLTATSNTNVANEMINRRFHRTGQIWTFFALIIMWMAPVIMSIILHTTIDWKLFAICAVLLSAYYLPSGVGEVIAYSYMLGINGTYLAFVTGNLSNLKIPCVINAVDIVGTKVGTEEHELACTISIAVSSIVTVLVILIGTIALAVSPLQQLLDSPKAQFLTPAFGTVAFALFGALGGKYLVKNPKVALFPFLIMTALTVIFNLVGIHCGIPKLISIAQPSYFLFVGVILCFIFAVIYSKKDEKKKAQMELQALAKEVNEMDNENDNIKSTQNNNIRDVIIENKEQNNTQEHIETKKEK